MVELTGDLILEQMRRDYGRAAFGKFLLLLIPGAGMCAYAVVRDLTAPVTIM